MKGKVNKEYIRRHQRIIDKNKDFIVSFKPPQSWYEEVAEAGLLGAEAGEVLRRLFSTFPTFEQALENINKAFNQAKEIFTKEESMENKYVCPFCGNTAWQIFGHTITCIQCGNDVVLAKLYTAKEFNRKLAVKKEIRLEEPGTGNKWVRDGDGWKESVHNTNRHYELKYAVINAGVETDHSFRFVAESIEEAHEKADIHLGLKGEEECKK